MRLPAACLAIHEDGAVVAREEVVDDWEANFAEHLVLARARWKHAVEREAPVFGCFQ